MTIFSALTPAAYARWTRLRDQLTHTRRSLGISQDDIADAAGVSSRTTIGRVERGEAIPGVETFIAHAQALQLEPVLVPPHIARFLDLEVEDISAIVRAAAISADDGLVLPSDLARRVKVSLAKLQAPAPAASDRPAVA